MFRFLQSFYTSLRLSICPALFSLFSFPLTIITLHLTNVQAFDNELIKSVHLNIYIHKTCILKIVIPTFLPCPIMSTLQSKRTCNIPLLPSSLKFLSFKNIFEWTSALVVTSGEWCCYWQLVIVQSTVMIDGSSLKSLYEITAHNNALVLLVVTSQ